MQHPQSRLAIVLLLLVWVAPVAVGAAGDIDTKTRDRVRNLMNDGGALFEQDQLEAARGKWMEAFTLVQIPTAALWAARANAKLGTLIAAEKMYESAIDVQPNSLWKGDTQQKAQAEAKQELAALRLRIPTLDIHIEGYAAPDEVTLDGSQLDLSGHPWRMPLDPGTYVLVATHGGKSVTKRVTLVESEHRTLHVKAPMDAAPNANATPNGVVTPPSGVVAPPSGVVVPPSGVVVPPSGVVVPPNSNEAHPAVATPSSTNNSMTRYAMWSSFGVGAAGLVLGATTGLIAWSKHSSLEDAGCTSNRCFDDQVSGKMNSYNDLRTVSTVGFVVAGVGAAAGVTLWLTRPKQASIASIGLLLSPNGVGATGSY